MSSTQEMSQQYPVWGGCGECEGDTFLCSASPASRKAVRCRGIVTATSEYGREAGAFIGMELLFAFGKTEEDTARLLLDEGSRLDIHGL